MPTIPSGTLQDPTNSQKVALHDDAHMLSALRRSEEQAFVYFMDKYSGPLLRLAMLYVSSRAVAEEVVQETWVGVLEGLPRFEGRSSFKTWLFRILMNKAKTKGQRESRYQPLLSQQSNQSEDEEESLESDVFLTTGSLAGHWAITPTRWDNDTPERLLLSKECREQIDKAIESLPFVQRQVITYRDIEGLTAHEVCNILDVTETNQRVLLHRARSHVRRELNEYLKIVNKRTL